jgi:hypothetical protein
MKALLMVMAVVEAGAGIALVAVPSLVASLLFGTPLEGAMPLLVGRLVGVALLSLGVACWLARDDDGRAATAVLGGMLVYNAGATALFLYSMFGLGLVGVLLWVAIIVHGALAIWCAVCLRAAYLPGGGVAR